MIVVFVVDTSPSLAAPSSTSTNHDGSGGAAAAAGLTKLDVAKMSVENLARNMDKRILEHNRSVLLASAKAASTKQQVDAGRLEQFDEFLLLSSSLQPDTLSSDKNVPSMEAVAAAAEAHASCGAGGRLLVGSVEDDRGSLSMMEGIPHPPDRSDFEHELKRLRTATIPPPDPKSGKKKFPEWAGGAHGLNAALSHGLGLLSRYRLTRGRIVEHFGMGRLPWTEHQMAKLSNKQQQGSGAGEDINAGKYDSPLQPACLILLTDGECLRLPPDEGGGGLSLRFGNMPLREFYREPFRWDQRIFILHIADASTPPLHKSLRALCEVTGGAYMRIGSSVPSLSKILSRISPTKPKTHSIVYPLRLPSMPVSVQSKDDTNSQPPNSPNVFVNGGPVCSFQCLEGGGAGMPSLHRAMILFAGSCEQERWILSSETTPSQSKFVQTPIWCIPESHFPSKKLDTLPPRPSQPLLYYSRNYQAVGCQVFDPYYVMKALHHLDHVHSIIRQVLVDAGDTPPPIVNRMLQRDVYICEWLGGHETATKSGPNEPNNATGAPRTVAGREHFPVCIRGAGRPALSGEEGENILNIGILHVPHNWLKLRDADSAVSDRLPTLTLLPPDAHILIPLLIKVAEMELRILKKATDTKDVSKAGATAGLIKKKVINSATAARSIHLDDNWKSDFRAYLFRLPPYYLPAIRRVLRPMLPPSVLSLLNIDTNESLPLSNMSPTCLMKIQNGEKAAISGLDWARSTEQNLRMRKARTVELQPQSDQAQTMGQSACQKKGQQQVVDFGYGNFDPRMTEHQYLNSLRNLPPPWKNGVKEPKQESSTNSQSSPISLLPSSCLVAYYESRRRWIFGGTGLTTRGLHVEGVNNDGTNSHHYSTSQNMDDQPLIALAGCGALCTNETDISKMGDFKERLSFTPTSFVDYSGCGAAGASITTGSDGAPNWSVDDDKIPVNFFDQATGEFIDTPQARSRSRMIINFGNPFHDKRGDSMVPEKFLSQRPTSKNDGDNGPATPPGSPPHDAYESDYSPIEGEGEAAFTGGRSPSPPRGPRKLLASNLLSLRSKKRSLGLNLKTEGDEKRRKAPPPQEETAKQSGAKAKPHAPPARPPPPSRRQPGPSSAPPPPPKPSQPQKQTPQKPGTSKPAPPHSQQSHAKQAHKHAPHKPAPPKRQTSDDIGAPTPTKAQQPQPQEDIAAQMQNPGAKPNIKLPEGWICVWSKSQKRWYFFDTRTNKSVWDPDHVKV